MDIRGTSEGCVFIHYAKPWPPKAYHIPRPIMCLSLIDDPIVSAGSNFTARQH